MAGPGPCIGGGMTAGPGGGGAGGAPTCSCQGGCSGNNGGGNSGNNGGGYPPPCRHGQGPVQPPTGPHTDQIMLLNQAGIAIAGPLITCLETGVSRVVVCWVQTLFDYDIETPRTYVSAAGPASLCMPPTIHGTVTAGEATASELDTSVQIWVDMTV
jgi:hypothetical protein